MSIVITRAGDCSATRARTFVITPFDASGNVLQSLEDAVARVVTMTPATDATMPDCDPWPHTSPCTNGDAVCCTVVWIKKPYDWHGITHGDGTAVIGEWTPLDLFRHADPDEAARQHAIIAASVQAQLQSGQFLQATEVA